MIKKFKLLFETDDENSNQAIVEGMTRILQDQYPIQVIVAELIDAGSEIDNLNTGLIEKK